MRQELRPVGTYVVPLDSRSETPARQGATLRACLDALDLRAQPVVLGDDEPLAQRAQRVPVAVQCVVGQAR